MDPLAKMWAEREASHQFRRNLAVLAREFREKQRAVETLRKLASDARKARMRQEGSSGFVMVLPD